MSLFPSFYFQIFSYGHNDYGQLGRLNEGIAELIEGNLKNRMITKVSCGAYFSVAILDEGEVYYPLLIDENFSICIL